MVDNPVWAICERVAEVQALLDDHIAGGKHSAADVIAKAQAVLSESELLRAMFDCRKQKIKARTIKGQHPVRTASMSLAGRIAPEQVGIGFDHLDELGEIVDAVVGEMSIGFQI